MCDHQPFTVLIQCWLSVNWQAKPSASCVAILHSTCKMTVVPGHSSMIALLSQVMDGSFEVPEVSLSWPSVSFTHSMYRIWACERSEHFLQCCPSVVLILLVPRQCSASDQWFECLCYSTLSALGSDGMACSGSSPVLVLTDFTLMLSVAEAMQPLIPRYSPYTERREPGCQAQPYIMNRVPQKT